MRLDALTVEILRTYLQGAVEEMAYVVERTAYTTFVKETADFTCGLLNPQGEFFAYPIELGVASFGGISYAATLEEIETLRKAFIRKWRLRHRPVADCLEEAGDRLFTFTRLPPSQWRSARTTNAIERLHEEFKRRIKTQTVLPSADTAAMLFWALLASGQINMRKVDGWQTLATNPIDQQIDLAA